MFRKPKRCAKKVGLRRTKATRDEEKEEEEAGAARPADDRGDDDDDDDDQDETSLELLQEARKRAKLGSGSGGVNKSSSATATAASGSSKSSLHHFEASTTTISQKELATSTNEYHPTELSKTKSERQEAATASASASSTAKAAPPRNKFLAGPIRAPTNVRTTSRFDYQPDVCKDYKETGFCGFGDTCIYLHDRGDTLSGWQLEQAWQQKQDAKKKLQERQMEAFLNGTSAYREVGGEGEDGNMDGDGLPFACFLCRQAFKDPVVTTCGHYFCQDCLQQELQKVGGGGGDGDGGIRSNSNNQCPVCHTDTHGVMNQPTKLIAKKRKLLGRTATWQEFMDARLKKKDGSGGAGSEGVDD